MRNTIQILLSILNETAMDNRQATHRHIFRGQLARYQHATTIDVRRWWILLLLGVTLSACQSVSPAKTSNIVLVQSTAPESMPDTKWWQQFDDPVLHQLIERTASNNMEINLAVTRLQQAQAGMNASHARLWPTVSIGGGLSDSKSDLPTAVKQGKPDTNARQLSADLKWELDVFGSNRAAANAAAAEVQAASWGISGTQLLVISEVVRQYMTWQGATERLRLLDELIYNQQQTLQRTQSLRKEGMSSDFDLSRVQAEISHTQALLPPLHTLRAISQHRLSVLLGENPAAPSFVLTAKPINTWPTLQALPRQQQSELLKRRPDIRVAEQQLRASRSFSQVFCQCGMG
jgi:outer membrane protein, multidrug efflux system